jgi:predicted SnoaL-like aldol condensation-catalyzing enzyme
LEAAVATPERNKQLVREAFDTLFNRRDYAQAETYWSPEYIQHSAHIPPGRDGLTGHAEPAPWIVVDTVGVRDGKLVEHWDVVEDEVSRADSVSGLPMFGERFPDE